MNDGTNKIATGRSIGSVLRYCLCLAAAVALTISSASAAEIQEGKIRFAVPPWPGLTVKSTITADILETIGYETEFVNVGTSVAFQGLANRDIDVYMGYWSPNQDEMAMKFLDNGEIEHLADNIEQAKWGIGVPGYVWDAGVRSVTDLDKNKDRFGGKIYGIEGGSALTKNFREAVDNDVAGLGDWEVVASSTAGMLSQVERATSREEWIAWGAWAPHWMMEAYDTRILENTTDVLLANAVTVRTAVTSGLKDVNPEAWRFLEQVRITSATQSAWIYEYDRNDRDLDVVATEWIRNNMDTVRQWLDGIDTRDGRTAAEAVAEAY